MKYIDYSVRDFIQDEYFQNWVFHTDEGISSFWENWLESHPHKKAEIQQARELLSLMRFENYALPPGEVAQLWDRIQEGNVNPAEEVSGSSHKMQWFAGIAAAVALITFGTVYFFTSTHPWKQYHTLFGQTEHVTLPDGSSVVLNANSTLTLYAKWDATHTREIWIDGEAYFDVVHTSNDQPFKVNTKDGVTVEVLGTAFNVYNRINQTKVVLNSGQIRLKLPMAEESGTILMKPGEMVEYESQQYHKKEVNPQLYTSWTNDKIMLDHTTLEEMVYMLRDTYGLQLKVSNPQLLKETVSGSMPLGNAEVLLQQMAKAFRLKVVKDGNVITVDELK